MTESTSVLSGETGTPAASAADPAAGTGALSVVTEIQQQGATQTWTDQIADATVKNYTITKGWKTPGDVAQGYMHLEKLLSGEKIPLPKGEADAEGWNRLYKAAGRPETPEGYKLPQSATGDKGFSDEAAKVFHAAGLSAKQATDLAKWYSEFGGRMSTAQAQSIERRNTQELEQFKTEQGALFDAKLELGRRAAKQFGFTNAELLAFEREHGTKTLLTRFAAIGEAMGEHTVTGEGATGFGLSATGAAARIAELKNDKEWTAKYLAGDADARSMMMNLQAAAAGMTAQDYQATLGTVVRR